MAGDKILLLSNFNENVYTGPLVATLSSNNLCLSKMCFRTTGAVLPPTHMHGWVPINAVFGTSSLVSTSVALLPIQEGVGNHRVFFLNIASETILGDVFPQVIPITSRLLNSGSNKIRSNYILLLNQLTNRHLIFKKLLRINRDSNHISQAQVQLRMNRVNLELEQFMKSAEADSHKYKCNNIEWSPYASVWIHLQWLLARVQMFLLGKTEDPRNLFHNRQQRGVKDPWQITANELKAEFLVCKHNIELLKRHSLYFCLKYLTDLITDATLKRDIIHASKVMGIIHMEVSKKRWRRIYKSMCKARGRLTVAVKVPTAEGGHREYKIKEGFFGAVSPIILKLFQSALVAPCH